MHYLLLRVVLQVQVILFNLSGDGTFSGDWYLKPGDNLTGNSTNLLNQWVMLSAKSILLIS